MRIICVYNPEGKVTCGACILCPMCDIYKEWRKCEKTRTVSHKQKNGRNYHVTNFVPWNDNLLPECLLQKLIKAGETPVHISCCGGDKRQYVSAELDMVC
jgi:hypothetical protein